jgi:hypothetical protein
MVQTAGNVALAGVIFYSLVYVLALFHFKVLISDLVPVLVLGAGAFLVVLKFQPRYGRAQNLAAKSLLLGLTVVPLFSLAVQFVLDTDLVDVTGRSSFDFAKNAYGIGLLWALSGAAVQAGKINQSLTAALLLLLAISASILPLTNGAFVIDYGSLTLDAGLDSSLNHIVVGDFVVLLCAFAFGLAPVRYRLAVGLVGALCLMMLGGRSDLFLFVIAIFGYLKYAGRLSWLRLIFFAVLIAVFWFFAAATGSANDTNGLSLEQVLFLNGVGSDASFLERIDILTRSGNDLLRQVWVGDPTLIVKNFGFLSAYIHNLLSAWQIYGFPFFLIVIFAYKHAIRFVLRRVVDYNCSVDAFGLLLLFYSILSSVLTKWIGFYLLWFSLGFWLARSFCAPPRMLGLSAVARPRR